MKDKKDLNFSDLFSEISDDKLDSKKDNSNKTFNSLLTSYKKDDSNSNISFNSIFSDLNDENVMVDSNKKENDTIDSDNLALVNNNEVITDDKTRKTVTSNNLFFDSDKVDDTVDSNEKENDTINSDNKDEVITDDKTRKTVTSNNLIFDSDKINNLNDKKDDVEVNNINDVDFSNIFLESSDFESSNNTDSSSIKENEISNNETSFTNDNNSIENNDDNSSKKLSSPFFSAIDTIDENNPFFDNSLNLEQNTKHEVNDGKIDISSSKHFDVKIVKKKEPLLKFIIGVISYAFFIWLLLIGITLLIYVADIKIRAMKGDYSSPKYNAYVVLTGSMLPEIQVYDVVITKKVDPSKLKVDDIITFASSDTRFEGTIITHRIINTYHDASTDAYSFQTRGDNNNVADSALVPSSNIYGKVVLKIPKLGYLQKFLASQGGWIIVILIPCLLVISYDIVKLFKSMRGKKYKKLKVTK